MKKKLLLLITALLVACTPITPDSPESASHLKGSPVVLATTTFLADIAQNVAGDRIQIEFLLPYGADAHSYQPIPQDVTRIANSDLLIVNGAGYEHFLEDVIANAGGERSIVEASVDLRAATEVHGENIELDPHFWLDPNYVITYVEKIRVGLTELDPDGAQVYQANADAYVQELQALDAWIAGQIALIPADRRLLVTNHDSLGYFAERYGFTVVGTVVEGTSSNAAPSAQHMAALIDQIKDTGVPAVFIDSAESTTLANQIAADAGVTVVTDLYFSSLTEGSPAGTYVEMMKHNVTRIVEALK